MIVMARYVFMMIEYCAYLGTSLPVPQPSHYPINIIIILNSRNEREEKKSDELSGNSFGPQQLSL